MGVGPHFDALMVQLWDMRLMVSTTQTVSFVKRSGRVAQEWDEQNQTNSCCCLRCLV